MYQSINDADDCDTERCRSTDTSKAVEGLADVIFFITEGIQDVRISAESIFSQLSLILMSDLKTNEDEAYIELLNAHKQFLLRMGISEDLISDISTPDGFVDYELVKFRDNFSLNLRDAYMDR